MPPEEFFNNKESAKYLGVTPGTLEVWRCENRYAIPFFRVGSRIRYRRTDLDAFLLSRRVVPVEPKRGIRRTRRTRRGSK
jgi:excisionase family DNA binding protein